MQPLPAAAALLGAAMCSAPSLAQVSPDCVGAVDRAAVAAVNHIPVIGQTTAHGSPFALKPGVLRVEVDVFGPQSQVYAVDVSIDSACRVLATSARLESEAEFPR